jgi:hypothetical protein
LHHLGHLGISGNADVPNGVMFTDHQGQPLDSCGRPVPSRRPVMADARELGIAAGAWSHPTGERLEPGAVYFNDPPPDASPAGRPASSWLLVPYGPAGTG